MYYVYVLKSSQDGELYIGSTNDLKKRMEEHNARKVQSTQHRAPFTLKYYEAYQDEYDARKRESKLKKRGNAKTWLIKRISRSIEN
jgi:predicted GIY-YIG superfamily endonuclease